MLLFLLVAFNSEPLQLGLQLVGVQQVLPLSVGLLELLSQLAIHVLQLVKLCPQLRVFEHQALVVAVQVFNLLLHELDILVDLLDLLNFQLEFVALNLERHLRRFELEHLVLEFVLEVSDLLLLLLDLLLQIL